MTRICTICARAGSKGVPGKNIKEVAGLPLIAWSLNQARESALFDTIAVSSDSAEILEIANRYGAGLLVRRPEAMATDTAGKMDAIHHCAVAAERGLGRQAVTIVDLDATSPLRLVDDIVAVVQLLESTDSCSVITGAMARRSPYFNLVEINETGYVEMSKQAPSPIMRRQDSPQCFDMNASIYAWDRDALMSTPRVFYDTTRLYEMPDTRSIDIDSELDLAMVEYLFRQRHGESAA
ncbi:MAG: acylneuraminate cytidylyltransferase family protein [Granulosicoccus sp.]|nr:acylneuraminate cytidylyltransferase family protein [Granulosicoccus sp.]